MTDVVRRLSLSADGEAGEKLLARSAITQARQRVGAAPLEWLFHQTAQTWGAEHYPKDDWHGLQLFAVDGAQFRTQDEPELREYYGSANTATERQSAYPVMRLVALMNLGSHILLDAMVHSEMLPFHPLPGNPFYWGGMEWVSLLLLPLFIWLIGQYLSGTVALARRSLAALRYGRH